MTQEYAPPKAGDRFVNLVATGEMSTLPNPPCAVMVCDCGRKRVVPLEAIGLITNCGLHGKWEWKR